MRNASRLSIFALALAFVTGACGDKNNSVTPDDASSPDMGVADMAVDADQPFFECGAASVAGTSPAGSVLLEHGVAAVAYDIAPDGDSLSLELLDANDAKLATLTLETRSLDILSATSSLQILDDQDSVVLTEKSEVHFIPGLGSRIQTVRSAGGSDLLIWSLATNSPTVSTLQIGADAAGVAGSPPMGTNVVRPDGEFNILTVYDPETQAFTSASAVAAWADAAGVSGTVTGEWETLKQAVFHDDWNLHALAHLSTCTTGKPVSVRSLRGLNTDSRDDDSITVRQALSGCAKDAETEAKHDHLSETLDAIHNVTGNLADGTIKGIIVANAHRFGVRGTIDLGGGFQLHVSPGDVAAFASLVGGLAEGGLVVSNPVGMALAGISAATYIAARVNDAFGDQIREAWEEAKSPSPSSSSESSSTATTTSGDPHLRTADGLAYDLQTQGEYIFARAKSGPPMEIHVRQGPMGGPCGANISYNQGLGTRIGPARVSIYPDDPRGQVRIDGELYDYSSTSPIFLEGGGIISGNARTPTLTYPAGDVLSVKKAATILNIRLDQAAFRRGTMEGLGGNFNGDYTDDIRTPDGVIFTEPVRWRDLVRSFADSWLVTAENSLLDYPAGGGPMDYYSALDPARPYTADDIATADADRARGVCTAAGVSDPNLLNDCILDVVCMGDEQAAESAVAIPPRHALEVELPILMDTWSVEGQPGNGDWVVAPDFLSVEQTRNGNPTFYVSDKDYRDVTISGSFRTGAAGDDDYMGFVFGYNAPFVTNGDDPQDFDFFTFAWKDLAQDVAPGGFTLAKVLGLTTDYNPGFWAQNDSPPLYDVIATDYGLGRDWTDDHLHRFQLSYGADRVQIAIDGRKVFDVTAAEAGLAEFPRGRFGFYNYSQPNVIYADFSVAPNTRELGVTRFDISEFVPETNMSLLRDAVVDGGVLRLTSGANSLGDAWHPDKIKLTDSFSTEFSFRMTNPSITDGRGFSLIFQNADNPYERLARGSFPGSLGYQDLPHSMAIEFDTQQEVAEPMVPHVSLQTRLDLPNTSEHLASIGVSMPGAVPAIDDGATHWARVDYDATTTQVSVFVDDPTVPVLVTTFDFSTLRLADGSGHIGFGGQTEAPRDIEILSWSWELR